jgi:hypothetical protein
MIGYVIDAAVKSFQEHVQCVHFSRGPGSAGELEELRFHPGKSRTKCANGVVMGREAKSFFEDAAVVQNEHLEFDIGANFAGNALNF